MMVQDAIQTALIILGLPFTIYGVYYVIIGVMGLFKSKEYPQAPPQKKFAAVIAARNEAGVVGNLIDSLKEQHYPKELYDIYVLPNNCTDNTEEVALAHGAKTFHCSSAVHSKGGALEEFFDRMDVPVPQVFEQSHANTTSLFTISSARLRIEFMRRTHSI